MTELTFTLACTFLDEETEQKLQMVWKMRMDRHHYRWNCPSEGRTKD